MTVSIQSRAPGVYLEEVLRRPAPALETGIPAFIGRLSAQGAGRPPFAGADRPAVPLDYAAWTAVDGGARPAWAEGFLGFAVRGFFENGGRRCYVAPLGDGGLDAAASALEGIDDFDLVCAPDAAGMDAAEMTKVHARLLDLCARRPGCIAVLDTAGTPLPLPGFGEADLAGAAERVKAQRPPAVRANGALYGPWVKVRGACPKCGGAGCASCAWTGQGLVPPSGHVAGVIARTDHRVGVHKAPANEVLEGAFDVQIRLEEGALADLNAAGVDCIRALPGRGIRVWGARTLAPDDPDFAHVNARRTYLTVSRWLEQSMDDVAFEPNDIRLWMRIGRQVTAFLDGLFRRGALYGASPTEAFYVKCDAETNPPEVREAGQVVTEVGLSLARPSEFVVVRLITGAGTARAGGA